ncbi:MAG TPA: DMT family transporter [Anaerovoracaceae bacterium]|nr:DMT family transporter [Anaerovoracaceae bacterium]
MNRKQLKGNLLLLTTSAIWGITFVAQRVGMDYVGPLTFNGVRFLIAALVLLPVVHFLERPSGGTEMAKPAAGQTELTAENLKRQRRTLITAGLACGSVLFTGSTLQQVGLVSTSAGKTAFITALYIVLVPILSVFMKHRPGLKCWIGVALGTVGLYFLCITSSFDIAPGDLIILIGAGFWAAHILVIDYFLPKLSTPIRLSMYQFIFVSVISLIGAVLLEEISLSAIISCAVPILFAGVLSGGIGFTFQILGQRYTNPTVASLILSLESVFGAVFGFLLLREIMSGREIAGCILMFCAIIISQLPDRKKPETVS